MKSNFLTSAAAATLICMFSVTPALCASKPITIAAIVGEDIISDYELNNRLEFLAATTGLKNIDDLEIKEQVLDSLINDVIKKQEAKKNGLSNDPKDVEDAIATLEQSNGMPQGSLKKKMQEAGIPYDTLRNQVDADLLWIKNAHMTLAPRISVTQEELNDRYKQYKEEEKKVRFLLGDIFVPFDSEEESKEVYKQMLDILHSLQSGESFNSLAIKYSSSPSSRNGGDSGWLTEDELDSASLTAIRTLQKGQVTIPIKTSNGYYIWLLRDKFDINEKQKLSLAKVTVPNDYKKKNKTYLKNLREKGTSCPAFIAEGKKIYSDGAGMLNPAFLEDFPENVQKVLKNLQPLSVSMAVSDEEKSMYFMICNSPTKQSSMTMDDMRKKIESEKLEAAASKKLRELRNSTIVEKRLTND